MFARTPRLLLRPGWIEDAPVLHRALADESVVRNLASAPWPYRLEDAEAYLARPADPRLPSSLIFSRTHGAPRLIGSCGVQARDDGSLELGYWIARPYWGLGFATEAAAAVIRMARASGLPTVAASHSIDNPASGNVLRKIGFIPTGKRERRFSRGRGMHIESLLYEDSGEMPVGSPLLSIDMDEDDRALAA